MEIDQVEELKSDQDKDLCIQITMEDIHRMERGIYKMKKCTSRSDAKKTLVKLFKERKTLEIVEKIDESSLKMLYQCFKILIYMIRIDRYRESHSWLVSFLKELVQRYENPVISMLNTVNGIDALRKAFRIEKEMTKEILSECLRMIEREPEEEMLIGNLRFLYLALENDEMIQNNEFGEYDDIFAEHYFRYSVYEKIFSQSEKTKSLGDSSEFYSLEEGFESVQYPIGKQRVLGSKREKVLQNFSEHKNELITELDTLYQNYQAARVKALSSSEKETQLIFLDKMEINCEDVFVEGRSLNFSGKDYKITEKEGTALEISKLVEFYQGIFQSRNVVKKTEESEEIKKIMNIWLSCKTLENLQDLNKRQELAKDFLKLLPKCGDGNLDMRYRISQEFLKEFIEYISV